MRKLLVSALALGAMSSVAMAQPAALSDAQLVQIVAGNPQTNTSTNGPVSQSSSITATQSASASATANVTCTTCTQSAANSANGTGGTAASAQNIGGVAVATATNVISVRQIGNITRQRNVQ